MNSPLHAGRGPAGSEVPDGIGLAFASVHQLLHAGELLRAAGFDVLVVPRRVQGCGAVLLIPQPSAEAAVALLAARKIRLVEEAPYTLQQEVSHE